MGGQAGLARFCRIRVTTPDGLRFNEPFAVDLELDATAPIEGARLGLTFNTVESQRILTLDSDAEGRTFDLPVGRHCCDPIESFALWEVPSGRRPFDRRGYVRRLASRQRADALAILRAQTGRFPSRILHC